MPGQLKLELWVAITISQAIDNWNPAAAAIPFTTQMLGIDKDLNLSIKLVQRSNIYFGFFDACNSLRSCPAENTGPYALRIIN